MTRTSSAVERHNTNGAGSLFCFTLVILLFSSISLPVGSPISSAIGGVLGSLPGIAVVTNIDTFSLTQTRYSDLNVAMPVAFFLMAVILFRNGDRILDFKINASYAFLFLFALIAGISAALYSEYVEALKLAIYVMGAACFFSFGPADRKDIARTLLLLCVVIGVVNAVITIWQYGTMSGWAFTPSTIRLYRPDGIFGDSIISALFSTLTIAILALGATRLRLPARIAVLLICFAAGVVTGARTFYYLLLIVGVYMMVAKTRNVSIGTKIFLLLAIVAIAVLVVSPFGQSMLDSLTFQNSTSSRDIKRQLALDKFMSSPIIGIGTSQYAVYEASLGMPSNLGLHGTNPHNMYVQVLCENGLVGFIPLVFGLIFSFGLAIKGKCPLATLLLILYAAIGWSLGILYSVAFTSFFVVLVCSLLVTQEQCLED